MIFINDNLGGFSFNQKVLNKCSGLTKAGLRLVCQNTLKSAKLATQKKDKTGRIYLISTKSGKIKRHQASAPGQSHANITRTLTQSMNYKVNSPTQALFGYDTTTKYGKYLELGTRKMKPRPTLRNAMKAERKTNNNIMANSIKPQNM